MDGESNGHVSIWQRLGHIFSHDSEDTLQQAIQEARADGEVEAEEESMLLGILRFNDLQVQDTMTPRTDIDCASQDLSVREVAAMVVSSGHSRILIYKDGRDNIVGVVHAKDLLCAMLDADPQERPISTIMREPFFVPETKSIRTLLQEFRSRKQHIAVALDEYGGTSGLITIEDLIEEIVGDIEDEHDKPSEDDMIDLGDGVWELSGRAFLEELAEVGVKIESEDVDTIGGYLSMEAGHVPTVGESFNIGDHTFTILDADKKHIKRLRMSPASESRKEQD